MFVKGKSGNPGGRPKAAVNITELLRARTSKNIANLQYWADQKEDGSIAVRANIALHEFAWGKASQSITGDGGGPVAIQISWLPAQTSSGS